MSAVILNWKRPANVARIVHGLRVHGVDDIIIWNNNPACNLPEVGPCTVIHTSRDLGLFTRFAAGCLAQHDCLLIQDDDLELPAESLQLLHDKWQQTPDVLHGRFGRRPQADGSYAQDMLGDKECPVVLTRVLMTHRQHCSAFFAEIDAFADLMADSQPHGNGEDIVFSYVARRHSGQLNRIWRFPIEELPAPAAIHGRVPGHMRHRSKIMRRCEERLKLNDQAPMTNAQ